MKLINPNFPTAPVDNMALVKHCKSPEDSPASMVGSSHELNSLRKIKLQNGVLTVEGTPPAIIQAEKVEANLSSQFPSFTKLMRKSHVINSFWMGFPWDFSKKYLPRTETIITLVDEDGTEFQLQYNARKMGLGGGWRNFSVAHKLLLNDVLIFELVEPCKFKVYAVRGIDLNEVDAALSLLNMRFTIEQNE